jgi:hypothetical protein
MARGQYPEAPYRSIAPDEPLVNTNKPKLGRFPWKWRLLAAGMMLLGIVNTYLSHHSPTPSPGSLSSTASTQAVPTPIAH